MPALFKLRNEVNAIYLTFIKALSLSIRLIDTWAQKIDGIILNTYEMIVAVFSMIDKTNQVRFFEKTFLVANVNLEIVFRIPFLILSIADIDFLD